MSGYTLRPLAWSGSLISGGEGNPPSNLFDFNPFMMAGQSFNGDGDGGVCTQAADDGKDITFNDASFGSFNSMWMYFDPTPLPGGAPIDRVKVRVRAKGVNFVIDNSLQAGTGGFEIAIVVPEPGGANINFPIGTLGPAYSWVETNWMTVNPATGLPWQRESMFFDSSTLTTGFFQGWIFDFYCAAPGGTFGVDAFELVINDLPAAATWWFNPTSGHYRYAEESPGAPFVASDPPAPTITGFSPRSS